MSDEIVKAPEEVLTELEREELRKWRGSEQPTLALSTSVKMYELFVMGKSCAEIAQINEHNFPVGMIIDARIRHEWDKHRTHYLDKLFTETGNLMRQRQVESVVFLGDILGAAHKEHGAKLSRFIQTGDPKHLPDSFKIDSIAKYKMVVDAFMKISGQDKKDNSGPSVQVIGNNVTLNEQPKKPNSQDALSILKLLEEADRK